MAFSTRSWLPLAPTPLPARRFAARHPLPQGERGRMTVKLDVHHQFHPRANSADPSRGLSVYRRLCAWEFDSVLDLDAAWLDRHFADRLVRAVFPRSGAGHARARGHCGGASRRARLDGDPGRAADTRPSAGATTMPSRTGVTRTGSRKNSAHQTVSKVPIQPSGVQIQNRIKLPSAKPPING